MHTQEKSSNIVTKALSWKNDTIIPSHDVQRFIYAIPFESANR